MATATPGQSRQFCLYDARSAEGDPLSLATFAADATTPAVVTIAIVASDYTTVAVSPVATTLTGENDYCTSTPITVPVSGDYYLDALVDYDGLAAHVYEDLTVRAPIVGGTTLAELRRRLGYRLGDIIMATATSDGDVNTFYDERTLRRADNAYRGWDLYIASAAVGGNEGESRFVQGSTQSGGVLTVQPALTAGGFAEGDIVELHGGAGIGWTVPEKHAAINDAIAQAATMGGISVVAETESLFDRDDPVLTVPSHLRFVHHLEWLDDDGRGRTVPYAKNRNKPGWWANKAQGTIEIFGDSRESAHGRVMRLWGHGDHIPLENDDDATLVNPTWIIAAAVYYLALGYGQDRNPEKMRSLIADSRQEMSIWRRAATVVRPSSSVAVRGY